VTAYETENLFLVVIDGLRADEGFSYTVGPSGEHPYIPWLWSLQSAGTLYTDIYNLNFTSTFSGHGQMLSGCPIVMPNYSYAGDYRNIRMDDPTIFEYYRRALGCPDEQARGIVGKTTLLRLAYSNHPAFGPEYSGLFEYADPRGTDQAVWSDLQVIMDEDKPSLVLVNLREVDSSGHSGVFEPHIERIRYADSICVELWSRLQADPVYADRTTMLITTDHGRHLDAPLCHGFRHHSGSCFGCRRTFLLALGPDTPEGLVIREPKDQQDIAATMAELLDIETPLLRCDPLWEMLGQPGPMAAIRPQYPSIVADGGVVRRVFVESDGDRHRLFTETTADGGASWQGRQKIFSSPWQIETPSINADVSGIYVAWAALVDLWNWTLFCTTIDKATGAVGKINRVYSSKPEFSLEALEFFKAMRMIQEPVCLAAGEDSRFILNAYNLDEILCHSLLAEPSTKNSSFNGPLGGTQGGDQSGAEGQGGQDKGIRPWQTVFTTRQSCFFIKDLDAALSRDGEIVVAYSDLSSYKEIQPGIERNYEIHLVIGRNGGLDWDAPIRVTADSCFSIHPTVSAGPPGEARVVWADNRSGRFQLYYSDIEIATGAVSIPRLLRENPYSDWQPDLRYDMSSESYLLAWTRFTGDNGDICWGRQQGDGDLELHLLESTTGYSQRPRLTIDRTTRDVWVAWEEVSEDGEWELRLSAIPLDRQK